MQGNRKTRRTSLFMLFIVALFALSGCFGKGGEATDTDMAASAPRESNMPYYIETYQDIPIPQELEWIREESMSIRTESFAGGTLVFKSSVDVKSLADFFTASMTKNGWKLVGSVTYQNILLAFTKPQRTCTVIILDGRFKTRTSIYLTDDIAARTGFAPFGEETLK